MLDVISDGNLLARVQELVARGHHRDEIPGLPGVGLDDPDLPAAYRRLFQRGTDEFAAAAAAGHLDRLPAPPPPANATQIAEAEALLGGPLPPLLGDLYRIANGGFGPGYGILGLSGGHTDDTGDDAQVILPRPAH